MVYLMGCWLKLVILGLLFNLLFKRNVVSMDRSRGSDDGDHEGRHLLPLIAADSRSQTSAVAELNPQSQRATRPDIRSRGSDDSSREGRHLVLPPQMTSQTAAVAEITPSRRIPAPLISMVLPVRIPHRVGPPTTEIFPPREAGVPRQWDIAMVEQFGTMVPFRRDRSPGMRVHTGHSRSPIRASVPQPQSRSRSPQSRSRSRPRKGQPTTPEFLTVDMMSTQIDDTSESITTTEEDECIE